MLISDCEAQYWTKCGCLWSPATEQQKKYILQETQASIYALGLLSYQPCKESEKNDCRCGKEPPYFSVWGTTVLPQAKQYLAEDRNLIWNDLKTKITELKESR